jgi:HD-like signal output (HDOD) protein
MLIIISQLPDRYRKLIYDQVRHQDMSFYEVELALGFEGCTHAELGGYFLDLWSLPGVLVEAALFHHDPGRASPENRGLINLLSYLGRVIDYIWKHRRAPQQDFSAFYLDKVAEADLDELFSEVRAAIKQYSSTTYKALYKQDLGVHD